MGTGAAGPQPNLAGALLRIYEHETWFDGTVSVWAGPTSAIRAATVVAAITFLLSDQRFVMVDVRNRGWDLPGGHLEGTETSVQALGREITEETGIPAEAVTNVVALGWIQLRPSNGHDPETAFAVYRANATGNPPLATHVPEEIRGVRTFTAAELRDLAVNRIWEPYLDAAIQSFDAGADQNVEDANPRARNGLGDVLSAVERLGERSHLVSLIPCGLHGLRKSVWLMHQPRGRAVGSRERCRGASPNPRASRWCCRSRRFSPS